MNLGTTATIIVPVKGLFAEVSPGLDARNAFTDFMEATGLCRWNFSEGGMFEWMVGFTNISDVAAFERNVVSHLSKLDLKSAYHITVCDRESPTRRTT
ncbi:MAG: hypothetical protein MUF81_17815 [Verrucomicrobia bacterium]|jgi:hypothetical protein|nr:hypothetical protein [Verrucomicrobiota bacterium]